MNTRTTLIENEYACLWYYPEDRIVHHKFLQPVSGSSFQDVLTAGLDLLKEQGAQKWLSDDRLNSILSAEDSAWSQEYWLPRAVQAGWRYWAILQPEKARGQINLKRLAGYVTAHYNVNVQLFPQLEEAFQWLKQSGNKA
jgi:hypothetical protein